MAARALVLITASATGAGATPAAPCTTCRGPAFSWDTIPKFIHTSNATGPVNQGALALMAKFPMVTVEKFQGPCGNSRQSSPACDEEAQIIEVLKGVKSINPNVSAIFYYNSVLDFDQYRLHAMMLADPSLMLHDTAGKVIKQGGGHKTSDVFDFTNPATRALFIEECINATKSGYVDGCFCDRAVDGTPSDSGNDQVPCGGAGAKPCHMNISGTKAAAYAAGHVQVLTDLQTALGEGPVIANHAYGAPHDNMAAGSVGFAMDEFFNADNASINTLLLSAANGRGVQAHGKPTEDMLAAFLIGAGYRAYYGIGGWSEFGPTFDDHWMPQFDMPLGAPLADATYDSATETWSRKFKAGVSVTFHCQGNYGNITGGRWTNSFNALL